VGIAGSHIRGVNSHGGITLGSRSREISREDVRMAVDRARSINMPEDREALHLLPQEFILDGQGGVRDPAGLMGRKLEVRVHIVTASATATQNVVTALNRAGVHVDDTVFEALACADSVLQTDERELGVCLIDIGAGSTDLIVYYEGVVIHTGAIPIGGDHFTNDVGVGFRTPLPDAENIKKMFGCAIVTRIPEGNEIEVPSVGDRPARMMQQRMLGEILEPRGRELMEMLRDHLRHAGMDELLGAGLVFTGGGSRLNGLLEVAEDIMRRPVRQGYPVPIAKLPSELLEPEFGTAIGMVLYGHRARQARMNLDRGLGAKIRALFAKQGA
jgi:cell division protein FtsA